MPDPALLTGLGQTFVEDIPLFLQDQADVIAVLYAQAKEHERLTARINGLVAEFLPTQATEVGLPVLEALVNTEISPAGKTVAERRALVVSYFGRLRSTPEGVDWVASIESIVGPGWSYREHVPGTSSPPAYTVLVLLPFPPSSDLYGRMEKLIRDVTPAHLDLIVTSAAGFALDSGRLDQDTL